MSNKDFKEVFAENIKVFYDKLQDKMHPLPVRMQKIKDDEVVFTGISVVQTPFGMQQTQTSFTVFANKSQGVGWVEGHLNQHQMKVIK